MVLVIEFFKQLTTLLLNLRPKVYAIDARDKLFHFALSAITYLTIINGFCLLNVDHKFLFNKIDILGNTTCFSSVNHVHKIEFEIKFESRFIIKRAKKQPRRNKNLILFLMPNDNIYNSKLLLILTPKLKAT